MKTKAKLTTKAKKIPEFKLGEIVVYPKHGVGEIKKIELSPVAKTILEKLIKESQSNL